MQEIQFKATIRKIGNSYMITIPKEYIAQEIKEDGTYFFKVILKDKQEVGINDKSEQSV